MWHIPVCLRTRALPRSQVIAASGKQISYMGSWFPLTTLADSDIAKLPRATLTRGGAAELSFEGTGVEYIAQKTVGQGRVDIYLDGIQQSDASLDLEDFPALFGVVIFSKYGLPPGKHVIKIVNASEKRANLESFRVYT